ncbi:hypothetical protein CRG98_004222 [Punica granatum]|uniref:Uncharacterized protein n=1 Tax=Punica granatum TaxID=22663 RepID=A0A2I0L432_PUNGR|nr:hypothetical protein CRG98_004222 [Punica granatum]
MAASAVWGKASRHASSGHGTVQEKNRMKLRLCTVGRASDHDHLFTEEGEGCEEPFERDGATRRSRGKKWHIGRLGKEEASLEPPAKGISRGLGLSRWSRGFEPRLGEKSWLDGSAWLSCGFHLIERKAGKRLKLD